MRFADLTKDQVNKFYKKYSDVMDRTHTCEDIFNLVIETMEEAADENGVEVQYKDDDYTYYKTCTDCKTEFVVDELGSQDTCPHCDYDQEQDRLERKHQIDVITRADY